MAPPKETAGLDEESNRQEARRITCNRMKCNLYLLGSEK